MAKYHISSSGKVVKCRAKGACPKAANFSSVKEAEASIEGTGTKIPKKPSQRAQDALRAAESYYGGQFLSPHRITLSKGVERALEDLQSIGNPLVVGGAVRDSFVGADNKDIDIEVHKTDMDTLIRTLKEKGYTVDEVGKQFGVLKASKKGVVSDLDISVPRKENRLGSGHRAFDVEIDKNMTVEEAAERRDFTFNAIMYDHKRGVIVDPAGGRKDMQNGVIQHVSPKFSEDPLRVLRGFQFAGRFNMSMSKETATLCRDLKDEYKDLSTERVQEEWGKFYTKSSHPLKSIQTLKATGWDDTIPGLKQSLNKRETLSALNNLPKIKKENRVVFGAAAIAKGMDAKDRKGFLSSTVVGIKEQKKALVLSEFNNADADSSYQRKILARKLERDGFTFSDYYDYSRMSGDRKGADVSQKAIYEGLGKGSEPDMVSGKDIIPLTDKKPGKWMGQLLDEVRDRQYRGEFADKKAALEYAKILLKR